MIAAYAASFDPPTLGHIDIIKRASKIAHNLHIIVAYNSDKAGLYMFSPDKRKELLESVCTGLGLNNAVVHILYGGYLVGFCRTLGVDTIIRGVRDGKDCDYEMNMAHENNAIADDIDTIFFPSLKQLTHISSSLVRAHLPNLGWEQRVSELVDANTMRTLQNQVYTSKIEGYWKKIGAMGDKQKWISHYDDSRRVYHNSRHVYEMLCWSEILGEKLSNEMIAAILFHDYCYQLGSVTNEDQSAKEVGNFLLTHINANRVRELIRSTKFGIAHEDYDSKLLHDLDYLILATNKFRYQEYVEGIRQEYSCLEPSEFCCGRIDFLHKIKDRCFELEHVQNKYGNIARANIERETHELVFETQTKEN